MLKKYIDMGEVLGCSFFHHTYGPILEGQSKSAYLKTAVRVAKETAAYARERGMELLIEPQGATMNGVEMLSAYFDQMGDDAWLILDTGKNFLNVFFVCDVQLHENSLAAVCFDFLNNFGALIFIHIQQNYGRSRFCKNLCTALANAVCGARDRNCHTVKIKHIFLHSIRFF